MKKVYLNERHLDLNPKTTKMLTKSKNAKTKSKKKKIKPENENLQHQELVLRNIFLFSKCELKLATSPSVLGALGYPHVKKKSASVEWLPFVYHIILEEPI